MTTSRPANGGGRSRRPRLLLIAATLLAALGTTLGPVAATRPAVAVGAAGVTGRSGPQWGVYTAPGVSGVRGAGAYETATGIPVTRVLDFLPDDSWLEITRIGWLVDAYAGSGYSLELSVPMLPRSGHSTLTACAQGAYDGHWRTIARHIRAAGLRGTIIRPGWEANGDWYPWSVRGNRWSYISCFRHVVDAMRSQYDDLRFSWTVNAGPNPVPGESLYPGSAWVDLVGVDVYDFSWTWYPAPYGTSVDEARRRAAQDIVGGGRGLRFWSDFAVRQGRPLALPEWGLSWRADGHGGGDDVTFVDAILGFVQDPANHVEHATYFNPPASPDGTHNITARDHRFPLAAAEISRRSTS